MQIQSVKSKKLEAVLRGDISGIHPSHLLPLCDALYELRKAPNVCSLPPSLRPHRLDQFNGKRSVSKGLAWALKITAQWRLTFRINNNAVIDLDYLQYH